MFKKFRDLGLPAGPLAEPFDAWRSPSGRVMHRRPGCQPNATIATKAVPWDTSASDWCSKCADESAFYAGGHLSELQLLVRYIDTWEAIAAYGGRIARLPHFPTGRDGFDREATNWAALAGDETILQRDGWWSSESRTWLAANLDGYLSRARAALLEHRPDLPQVASLLRHLAAARLADTYQLPMRRLGLRACGYHDAGVLRDGQNACLSAGYQALTGAWASGADDDVCRSAAVAGVLQAAMDDGEGPQELAQVPLDTVLPISAPPVAAGPTGSTDAPATPAAADPLTVRDVVRAAWLQAVEGEAAALADAWMSTLRGTVTAYESGPRTAILLNSAHLYDTSEVDPRRTALTSSVLYSRAATREDEGRCVVSVPDELVDFFTVGRGHHYRGISNVRLGPVESSDTARTYETALRLVENGIDAAQALPTARAALLPTA